MREYTVIVHPDATGGYWTEVPALDGIGSQGETVDEALSMTRDAILLWIESLKERGQPIPDDKGLVMKVGVAA